MKKYSHLEFLKALFYTLIVVIYFINNHAFAGGGGSCPNSAQGSVPVCENIQPICSDQSYDFPNNYGQGSGGGSNVNYGCLESQPNPVWYYMDIAQSGQINIQISQSSGPNGTGTGLDVDFALWGPFTSYAAGCAAISGGDAPIQCSFSTDSQENMSLGGTGGSDGISGCGESTPPGAQAGEVYILCITNYQNQPGYISFNQTNFGNSGAGSTDCSIISPCSIDNFTATVSGCTSGLYSVSGTVEFTNPPSTGNLIVEDCNGNQTTVASAPFTSPVNYTIPGLNADGAACSVQTYFSDDNSCTQTINYTAPSCVCSFTSMNVTVGACNGANQFDVTGTVEFTDPPSTGQLIIEDCNGNSVSYNAPFTSPQNFAINGITADGATCNVTAHFSADAACTITSNNYTNPNSCECDAKIGTFTVTTDGTDLGGNSYVLCYGDQITITGNGDFVPPGQVANEPTGTTYDPAIGYLIYSCPPTIATSPSSTPPNDDINNDPCFLGIAGYSTATGGLYDIDDGSGLGSLGGLTNRTVYLVPITFYDQTNGYYSVINGGLPCYQMGTPIKIQYLTKIDTTKTEDCQAGTVSVQISGGSAEVNGTNFTASNLTPTSASISTNNVANGGTIVVSGLQDGDNYSFDIFDEYGCGVHVTGIFTGVNPSDFTYPNPAYCQNGSADPSPTITGTTGGTFTVTPSGLSIDASSGKIDLASSTPGTYTVTYTSPGAPCNSTTDFTITINAIPTITVADETICSGETATLTASGADTYVWSPATGLSATSGTTVQSTVTANQTYTINGTNAATGCVGTTTATVSVNPLPTIDAGMDVAICTGNSTTLTASGGSTYSWDNGLGTGAIQNVSPTSTTTYEVTGTDANSCVNTDQVTVTVNPLPTINAGADVAICSGASTTLSATGGSTYSWDNSLGSGASHTVSPTATTTYEVTGTDVNSCVNTDQVTVTVNPLPTYTSTITDATCGNANGEIDLVAASGSTPYTYSIDNGVSMQPSGAFTGLSSGNYSILISDNNGCKVTGTETINQLNQPSIGSITSTNPSCFSKCDGTATVTASGGSTPYVYAWTDINNTSVGTSNQATNLCDGQYTITITDTNGCTVSGTATLIEPAQIDTSFSLTNYCENDANAASNIATPGGVFSFSPDPGDGATINAATGTITDGVGGTTYTVQYKAIVGGCSATSTQDITVNPLPIPDFIADTLAGCAPFTVTFSQPGSLSGINCAWNFGDGGTSNACSPVTHTYTSSGSYTVSLDETTASGCKASQQIANYILVDPQPVADFSANPMTITSTDPIVHLTNNSTNATDYTWNFGDETADSHDENTTHEYNADKTEDYIITLIATDKYPACSDTASTVIRVKEQVLFYVPNTFTPDHDDYNETFKPIFASGYDPYSYTLLIFNRWGETLFESHNVNVGWDGTYGGKLVTDGTYVWKITFKEAKDMSDKHHTKVGHVNVLR